jgi:hypothetical protein
MPGASGLDTQSPESSEGLELPLEALAEGFQVALADPRVLWVFGGVGQGYGDKPSLGGPEGHSVDASESP